MDVRHRPDGADLFEVQMFLVDIGNGQNVWYGRLHKVADGEKHYFRGWSGLVARLQGILTPVAQLEVLEAFLSMRRRVEDKIT
jgi:hypothetical protein